jgi:hypothetical protein
MDWKALIDEVIANSVTKPPACKICGGKMMHAQVGVGTVTWACSSVKSINMAGDHRQFDPGHYENSKATAPNGVDLNLIRANLASAFMKVEEQTEARVREELLGDPKRKGRILTDDKK